MPTIIGTKLTSVSRDNREITIKAQVILKNYPQLLCFFRLFPTDSFPLEVSANFSFPLLDVFTTSSVFSISLVSLDFAKPDFTLCALLEPNLLPLLEALHFEPLLVESFTAVFGVSSLTFLGFSFVAVLGIVFCSSFGGAFCDKFQGNHLNP